MRVTVVASGETSGQSARVAVDRNDPVVVARREGRLAAYLRDSLDVIVGQPLNSIGRILNLVSLGFGDLVPVPTERKPSRVASRHAFHCACEVDIDGHDVWEEVEQHAAWLAALSPRPVCVAIDATNLGEVRITLAGEHLLSIRPESDQEIEHWRYFRMDEIESYLVVYEQTDY